MTKMILAATIVNVSTPLVNEIFRKSDKQKNQVEFIELPFL
jgi:hypothetical protein